MSNKYWAIVLFFCGIAIGMIISNMANADTTYQVDPVWVGDDSNNTDIYSIYDPERGYIGEQYIYTDPVTGDTSGEIVIQDNEE